MMTEMKDAENEAPLQRCPSTMSIQPASSKLQRLKRSLSFKTIMRSKSVENFFQRSYSDARPPPPDFITDAAAPPPQPPPSSPSSSSSSSSQPQQPPPPQQPPASPLARDRSPSVSPSLSPNPSLCSHSPSLSPSLSAAAAKPPGPQITHSFQEHVFRKPTSCQHCKHMIVGNSKQALRCKTCKIAAHLWCTSELSQQLCYGKSGAFKRNFSSPMLANDQLAVVKEVQPSQEAGRARLDPVYAALRYGTSLAQMSRTSFGSMSESPTRSLGEGGGEEREQRQYSMEEELTQETGVLPDAALPESEPGEEEITESGQSAETPAEEISVKVPKVHSVHTYVALYRFLPQEPNDLQLHPGDRVQVTDDSNEEWWKGKSGDNVGFFPANFVQRVRPGERVWRVTQSIHGNRERGHMPVKEDQICVGKQEDGEGYMRLSSGKKRGLVPAESIEEI